VTVVVMVVVVVPALQPAAHAVEQPPDWQPEPQVEEPSALQEEAQPEEHPLALQVSDLPLDEIRLPSHLSFSLISHSGKDTGLSPFSLWGHPDPVM
jgi:hypothetical protein